MLDAMLPFGRRQSLHRVVLIGFFVFLAGTVNIYLGKDYSWDLRNYHYYNGWAFLKHRIEIDVLPANLQGFHNPIIELPFYFLAARRVNDFFIAYAMAIPAAISMYFIWLITGKLVASSTNSYKLSLFALRITTVVAGVTGAAGWSQWGTTTGEWPVACLILIALFFVLHPSRSNRLRLAIGILLGLACGLKLTAIPFAAAVGLAYCYTELSPKAATKWRGVLVMITGGAFAFIVVISPWGWILWKHYHNPFFPYFNGIFQSDAIEKVNWRDARFIPSDLIGWLRIPFDLALHREAKYGDSSVRDPRALMAWILVISGAIIAWRSPRLRSNILSKQHIVISIVFMVSFTLWAIGFAIYRYAIGIEMVASLTIFAFLYATITEASRWPRWIGVFLYASLFTTSVDSLGRARFNGGAYFQESLPPIPHGSLVINYVPIDPPLGFISPLLGSHVTVVKPLSNLSRPGWNEVFQDRIRTIVAAHRGRIFVIQRPPMDPSTRAYLAHLGLSPLEAPCTSISGQTYTLVDYVCEFRRIDN